MRSRWRLYLNANNNDNHVFEATTAGVCAQFPKTHTQMFFTPRYPAAQLNYDAFREIYGCIANGRVLCMIARICAHTLREST